MRDEILKKSLELFIKHGLKTVTMDDIAKELGISKKTIYQHYPSKYDLIKNGIDYLYTTIIDKLKSIVGTCETPIHEHFRMHNCLGDLLGYKVLPTTIHQFNKYYPRLSDRIQKRRKEDFEFTVLRNLKDGIRLGYYRESVDPNFIGHLFFTSSSVIFHDESFMKFSEMDSLEDLDFQFLEYHLRGIVTPKGLEILEQLLNTYNTNEI